MQDHATPGENLALPNFGPTPSNLSAPVTVNAGTRGLQVLLVEDDGVVASILTRLFDHRLNASVVWVQSAEAAAAPLGRGDWDLVLVDLGLPGASGFDLVRASTERHPDIPHVIISGRREPSDVIAAVREGADDYIVKPIDPDDLVSTVERVINRRRQKVKPPERVLAIGAHPDDVEIGVGGTLRRHAESGDQVTILTLTGGEQGGDSGRRATEARRAAELLGCRLIHEGLTDTMISSGPATIDVITRAVESVRPTIIYTHTANDVHQDHRGANQATLIAARRIQRIYAYQAPSTNIDFRPSRFVQVGPYFEVKMQSIRAHASQADRAYLDEDLLRSTARYWGRFAGGGLVEAFEIARETETEAWASMQDERPTTPLELERSPA
jgi:LmbE family N-acetylglucosaminyl deacetylase